LVGLAVSYSVGGGAGFLLGFGSTAFNFAAGWFVVRMVGTLGEHQAPARLGAILAGLAFLVKLPIWVMAALTTQRLGGSHMGCFLGGLALVYFGTVGRSLATRNE